MGGIEMTFLYYFVLVLHIFACAFLIGVVLLQQGKGLLEGALQSPAGGSALDTAQISDGLREALRVGSAG